MFLTERPSYYGTERFRLARRLWIAVVAWSQTVSMRDRLVDSIRWLESQGDFSVGLALILATITIGIAWDFFKWCLRWIGSKGIGKWRAWRESRRLPEVPRGGVGIYDHAINAEGALKRMPEAMMQCVNCCDRITEKLSRHAARFSQEQNAHQRKALIVRLEKDVRPDVTMLVKNARRFADDGELIIESYRSLFHKTLLPTLPARLGLLHERDIFVRSGRQFPEAIRTLEQRRSVVATLTDIVPSVGHKYEESLAVMSACLRQLVPFCTKEAPAIINARVGRLARVVAFLGRLLRR